MCDTNPTADLAAYRIRRRLRAAGIESDVAEVESGERHRAPQHGPYAWHTVLAAAVVTLADAADAPAAVAHLAAAGFAADTDGPTVTVTLPAGAEVAADLDARPAELVAAEEEERAAAPVLVVIGCGKDKRTEPAPAGQLYTGQHHRRARAAADVLAERIGARVMILSAKHGLLDLADVVAPYDVTLTRGPRVHRGGPVVGTVDAATVARQLRATGARAVVSLAATAYTRLLAGGAAATGAELVAPLAGTGSIFDQVRRLTEIRTSGDLADAIADAVAGPVPIAPAPEPEPVEGPRGQLALFAA